MRESKAQKSLRRVAETEEAKVVAYDEKTFFDSHYAATVRGTPTDRMTIGAVSDIESRFHYNSTENSIIRALSHLEPPPTGPTATAWKMMRQRLGLRMLDVGSGTGHWIDFMMDVYDIAEAVAVEITEAMATFLESKYDKGNVLVLRDDIVDSSFTAQHCGGPVQYITAIGVMFHIVDDTRWVKALQNLADVLADDGVLIVGGDFGTETRNVQFHSVDEFQSWSEHDRAALESGSNRVNKRIRSLAHWTQAARKVGLEVVDVVRSDFDPTLTTPENDILLLRRAGT